MAFTPNDDLNILQASDNSVIGAGRGDDTYILSPGTMSPGQRITISDTQGVNTLQALDGLEISSAIVANNAAQVTLSNGAVVTLLDAASFNFSVGGTVGSPAASQTYEEFVANELGVSVPAAGEDPISFDFDADKDIGEPIYDPIFNFTDREMGNARPLNFQNSPSGNDWARNAHHVEFSIDESNGFFSINLDQDYVYAINTISYFEPFSDFGIGNKDGIMLDMDSLYIQNAVELDGIWHDSRNIAPFEPPYTGEYYIRSGWNPGSYYDDGIIGVYEYEPGFWG